jgi:hypothetical protein
MTCNQHYGIANYPPCSGNGDCIHGRCKCHEYWFDISDYNIQRGLDCDHNINVIKYWSLAIVVIAAINIVLILFCLYKEIRYVLSKSRPIWSLEGKHSLMAFAWLANASLFIVFALKYSSPTTEVLGLAPDIWTIMFALGAFSFIGFTISVLHHVVVKFLRGYLIFVDIHIREHITSVMKKTTTVAAIYPLANTIVMLALSLAVFFDEGRSASTLVIIILLTIAIHFLYYACAVLYLGHLFLNEMNKYCLQMRAQDEERGLTANEKVTYDSMELLYKRLKYIYTISRPIVLGSIPLNFIFVCWNFLRRKITYLLLFLSLMFLIASPVIVLAIRSFEIFPSRGKAQETASDAKKAPLPVASVSMRQTNHLTSAKDIKQVIAFMKDSSSSKVMPFSPLNHKPQMKHLNTFDIACSEHEDHP